MHSLSALSGLSGMVVGGGFFSDNFNDGVADSFWALGPTAVEQNGRMELGPGGVNGYVVSAAGHNFVATNFYSWHQFASHNTFFRAYLDGGADYLEIRTSPDSGLVRFGYHKATDGSDTWLFSPGYDAAAYAYLMFKYNATAAQWEEWYSSDGVTWTLGAAIPTSVLGAGRTGVQFWALNVGAEMSWVDDFKSAVPI